MGDRYRQGTAQAHGPVRAGQAYALTTHRWTDVGLRWLRRVAALWDVATGKQVARLGEFKGPVRRRAPSVLQLAFTPTARVGRVSSGRQHPPLGCGTAATAAHAGRPPRRPLRACLFPGRQNSGLRGNGAGAIRLWDVATGKERVKAQGPVGGGGGGIVYVALSPDGRVSSLQGRGRADPPLGGSHGAGVAVLPHRGLAGGRGPRPGRQDPRRRGRTAEHDHPPRGGHGQTAPDPERTGAGAGRASPKRGLRPARPEPRLRTRRQTPCFRRCRRGTGNAPALGRGDRQVAPGVRGGRPRSRTWPSPPMARYSPQREATGTVRFASGKCPRGRNCDGSPARRGPLPAYGYADTFAELLAANRMGRALARNRVIQSVRTAWCIAATTHPLSTSASGR